jgi:hypothetical protein
LWSNGQTTDTLSGVIAGIYTVTVTDMLGTLTTATVTINEPTTALAATITVDANVSCFKGNNGALTANPSGGTPGYSYMWNTNATTQSISYLNAGLYTVQVKDANGCKIIVTQNVSQPAAALAVNINQTQTSCSANTGTLTSTVTGGTPNYSYLWSNSATTSSISGLTAGDYILQVTDSKGCIAKDTGTIVISSRPTIDAGPNKTVYLGYPDSSCAKLQSSGAGGGTPPYTLSWSTGSNASFINVCPTVSTVYYLTITDSKGCTAKDSVKVCVVDVRCGTGNRKVAICHRTGSSSNPSNSLCVDLADAKSHLLSHPGDKLGGCGTPTGCNYPASSNRGPENSAEVIISKAVIESTGKVNMVKAYPNPFSKSCRLEFSFSESAEYATLEIFDLNGVKVRTVFNGKVEAGIRYSPTLDASMFSPGVYIYKLSSRNTSEFGKIVLIK